MSKLLKSKFFLGTLVAAFVLVAGASTTLAYTHTMTLKMGSNNAQVMSAQQTLNMTACKVGAVGTAGGPGTETMYFGAKTKAAVQCFQASKGLTADGIVGPITGAALASVTGTVGVFPAGCTSAVGYSPLTGQACSGGVSLPAGCTSTAGYSPTTGMSCSGGGSVSNGPLVGGAGSLDDVQELSSLSSEQVAEGDTNAKIAGWTISADNGSDLAITAMHLSFDMTSGSGSQKLTKYASKVTVWQGSTKVGSADVADFSENSNVYSKTINLTGAVVKANQDSDFYVSVDALGSIDSLNLGHNTWKLTLESVRFQDATGAILTDSSTGDLPSDVNFSFETVASASGTELKVSLDTSSAGDAINKGHVVQVDDTSDTNDVPLLSFKMKATGKIQNIQNIPVEVVSTGTGTTDTIASSYSLWKDGVQIDTVSSGELTTSATNSTACTAADDCFIQFNDVDFDLSDGSTANMVVKADINDTSGTFANGDTLTLSMNGTTVDAIDAEDSNGDSVVAGDLTGTAVGEAVTFNTDGMTVSLIGTPTITKTYNRDAGTSGDADQATASIKFRVTAFGSDVYVDHTAPDTTGGATESDLDVTGSPTVAASITSQSGATDGTDGFLVEDGTSEDFTITVVLTATTNEFVSVKLTDLLYALTDVDGNLQYTSNLDSFKTDPIYVTVTP